MMAKLRASVVGVALWGVLGAVLWAGPLEFVTVGDPGNPPDTRYVAAGVGSVGYVYEIGKYEVTAAQYCDFLNAVASISDPYYLYNDYHMPDVLHEGCMILRSVEAGAYV